ncbi:MAG: dimethylarginine dimethylaminohydrolase family protein [Thermoanaerobaculia bacterium]
MISYAIMLALVRAVSPMIAECELTHLPRQPIDATLAAEQHQAYERCINGHGYTLIHVDPAPSMPDGVFVEDTVIVLDEVAVIMRPGAESRRRETETVELALEPYRPLEHIVSPATIDGGDVLRVGRTLYVGRSQRTTDDAIEQLREIVWTHGYTVVPTAFHGCLHLKSAVTQIGERTLLCNPGWIRPIEGLGMIAIDRAEPLAANVLRLDDTIIMAAEHPRTRAILERAGYAVETVSMSELLKAEAGVTCCSVIFRGVEVPPAL